MRNLNYNDFFHDAPGPEVSYDPHGAFGLLVAEQARASTPDPLDVICAIEEQLGCSLFEAARRYREMTNAKRTHNCN